MRTLGGATGERLAQQPWTSHGNMAPVFLNLRHIWRWVVHFMPKPRYFRKKFSRHRKVIWAQRAVVAVENRGVSYTRPERYTAPAWVKWERYETGFIAPSIVTNASCVVGILNRLRVGQPMNRWSISGTDKKISVLQNVHPSVGPTGVPIPLSLRVKQPTCEAGHSTPPTFEVENGWIYECNPFMCLHVVRRDKFTFTFLTKLLCHVHNKLDRQSQLYIVLWLCVWLCTEKIRLAVIRLLTSKYKDTFSTVRITWHCSTSA